MILVNKTVPRKEEQTTGWFSVPMYYGTVDNVNLMNRHLKPIVNKIRESKDLSNQWGDNTPTSFTHFNEDGSVSDMDPHHFPVKEFEDEIAQRCGNYIGHIRGETFTPDGYSPIITVMESWVNFAGKGHYQHYHTHPISDVSGVYYYQSDGNTPIIFQPPNPAIDYHYFPFNFCEIEMKYQLFPKTGDMILFPSWVPHAVRERNLMADDSNEEERISISFNIRLDKMSGCSSYTNLSREPIEK